MTTEAKCPLCSNTRFENIHINSASTGLSWMNRNYLTVVSGRSLSLPELRLHPAFCRARGYTQSAEIQAVGL